MPPTLWLGTGRSPSGYALVLGLVQQALATAARWRISYWDAAIVEAARIGNCPIVLSEDLQPGMNFAGVTVRNPFV